MTGGVKLKRVYFAEFIENFYKTLLTDVYRDRMRFVFNFFDIDSDGIIKAQDLTKCVEMINMDTRFGKELQAILDYYSSTHLRPRVKAKITDQIDFEKYLTVMQKAFGGPSGKPVESCLIPELIKKMLAKDGKFKKDSIFVCTNEELIEAVKRKNKFLGIAEAIISGKEHVIPTFDAENLTPAELKAMLMQPTEGDKKKSVHFNVPASKKNQSSLQV